MDALLGLSATADLTEPEAPLTVQYSYTGKVRMIFGDQFRIPLARVGCAGDGSFEERARCFLAEAGGSFGLQRQADELAFEIDHGLPNGSRLVRFEQRFQGVPVFYSKLSLIISQSDEVTQVYSTFVDGLALPAEISSIAESHQAFDGEAARDRAALELGSPVRLEDLVHGVYVDTDSESTTAIPAVWGLAVREALVPRKDLVVFSAPDGAVLHRREASGHLPTRRLKTTGVHPFYQNGYTCQTHDDCNPGWGTCSADYNPKRCVMPCTHDVHCHQLWGKCMISAGKLNGYCYMPEGDLPTGNELQVWSSSGGWTQEAFSVHKAYSKVQESLNAIVDYHYNDLGMNGWDEQGSAYATYLESVCQCADPQNCLEYEGCPAGHQCGDAVCLNYWMNDWTATNDWSVFWRENVHGHEWRHVVGMGHNQGFAHYDTCLWEGITDMDGAIFAAKRNGENHEHPECGQTTNSYADDRNALTPGCHPSRFPYAHRSRLDWLDCGEELRYWGVTCTTDANCNRYDVCRVWSGVEKKCTNDPSPYHAKYLWRRLIRLVTQGSGAFSGETIGIPNSPVGWLTTARIFNQANLQVFGSTTLRDYLGLLQSAGLGYGKYSQMVNAIGAAGFFPRILTNYSETSDRNPIAYNWPAYHSTYKNILVWKQTGNSNLRVRYHDGSAWVVDTIAANTNARPAVVVHGSYMHIFWRDQTTGQIKVMLLHYWGYWYGPFTIDPGSGQLRPNGAFGAATFNDRLYLVFSDTTDGNKLKMARCNSSTVCYTNNQFHDFGGGVYKKTVANVAVLPGPSAVAATLVNGRPWLGLDLYVAWAYQSTGALVVTRVDTDDIVQQNYYMSNTSPSWRTNAPLDIMVRASAFGQFCGFFPCDRNYLYLAWKDKDSNKVFTSVLQNAGSSYWITRPAYALVDVRSGTGVSWTKGIPTTNNLYTITVTQTSYGTRTIEGYGRY